MTKHLLSGVILCGLAAGLANGAVLRYRQSGDWTTLNSDGASPGWGLDPNNDGVTPGTSLPGAADQARINWGNNTVTVSTAIPTVDRLMIGVNESGNVVVNSGGVVTANTVLAGNNNASATGTLIVNTGAIVNVGGILYAGHNDSTGFITINSGGQVNVDNHLWFGTTGTATINISGTLSQTGGILGLGTDNAVDPRGGTATVNILNGGVLALNNIHGGGTSIQPGSLIDISGTGQLTIPNNFVGVLTSYANNGYLAGNGVPGMANLNIDTTTNPGFTTVTAVPETSTLGLLSALGTLGLLLRRRS